MNIEEDQNVTEYKLYEEKILDVQCFDPLSQVIFVLETGIDVIKIKRGIKKGNQFEGHSGPIVSILLIDPSKLSKGNNMDSPKFILSSSLDL